MVQFIEKIYHLINKIIKNGYIISKISIRIWRENNRRDLSKGKQYQKGGYGAQKYQKGVDSYQKDSLSGQKYGKDIQKKGEYGVDAQKHGKLDYQQKRLEVQDYKIGKNAQNQDQHKTDLSLGKKYQQAGYGVDSKKGALSDKKYHK